MLTPRRRVNLILYLRRPGPATTDDADASRAKSSVGAGEDAGHAGPSRPGAYQSADLMRRTFGFDVLACPRCGGRLRLVALIDKRRWCSESCDTSACRRRYPSRGRHGRRRRLETLEG